MNRIKFFSTFYRQIVRMHPEPFRLRFGDEMLWIFEEECRQGAAVRVFCDGVLSLLRQRFRIENGPEPVVVGFSLLDTGVGLAPRRFVEAGVAASLLLAGFMLLLSKTGTPLMVPACLPGAPRSAPRLLESPSRIEGLPIAMPNDHSQRGLGQRRLERLGSGEVNSSAASAVRIVRAQELQRSMAAGSCLER
jgi:hypothetical protein